MATWQCPDCGLKIHRHPDPQHETEIQVRQIQDAHHQIHAAQLAECGGDPDMLALRLRSPATHAAVLDAKAKQLDRQRHGRDGHRAWTAPIEHGEA